MQVLGQVLRQLFGFILGLGILSFSSVSVANDRVEADSVKTKSLGGYQIQLVCDPERDESKPERCKIIIIDPKSVDQSNATLDLSLTDISLDTEQNTRETSSLFSAKALDKKETTQEIESYKYKISRDWLFRLKITEGDKKPDISILTIIVPNDKSTAIKH